MRLLGNILWVLLGGWLSALEWLVAGCIWCVTIVGIPLGMQCFKFAALSLCPFGKQILFQGGGASVLLNVIWTIFFGLPMAIVNGFCGCVLYLTIIGIPFGKQYFKIAHLALSPFGSQIVELYG